MTAPRHRRPRRFRPLGTRARALLETLHGEAFVSDDLGRLPDSRVAEIREHVVLASLRKQVEIVRRLVAETRSRTERISPTTTDDAEGPLHG
jgi:hypothetical protein